MDITEQRLNEMYDAFAAEQMALTTLMRNRTDEGQEKEKTISKQLSLIMVQTKSLLLM
jgi:hypothetical protein